MAGPKAPKDPERKRPYFYIMKDKDIYGSVQEDGSIIHFIYESDGRLINSAQIAGNIENKEELGLLETVEGFGRLVHSIGVSVETDNQNEQIEFVFQMYGKQDLYGGGTNLKVKLTGDGMERKIYLSDYKWTPDDDIPGQIKFIFNTPDIMGKASVRLYLNDGYEAPADIEETEVDMNSDEYCRMISHSLMNMGNAYRIRKAIEKTRAGKEVTLAYIGGSITQGAGAAPINTECYAYKSYQLFQKRFSAKNNVKFIKAGVGGTVITSAVIIKEKAWVYSDCFFSQIIRIRPRSSGILCCHYKIAAMRYIGRYHIKSSFMISYGRCKNTSRYFFIFHA